MTISLQCVLSLHSLSWLADDLKKPHPYFCSFKHILIICHCFPRFVFSYLAIIPNTPHLKRNYHLLSSVHLNYNYSFSYPGWKIGIIFNLFFIFTSYNLKICQTLQSVYASLYSLPLPWQDFLVHRWIIAVDSFVYFLSLVSSPSNLYAPDRIFSFNTIFLMSLLFLNFFNESLFV